LCSADRNRVGRRAPDVYVAQNFARADVIPIAGLRRIALKYATVSTDNTVSARAHEIRQVHARRRKTVKIKSSAAGILIHVVLKYDYVPLEDIIATRYAKVGF